MEAAVAAERPGHRGHGGKATERPGDDDRVDMLVSIAA